MHRQRTTGLPALSPLLSLLALLVLVATPCFAELTNMPDCEGPGCLRTAEPAEWPVSLGQGAFTMELERFVISLPSFPKRTVLDRTGTVIILCQDGSALSFDLESKYALAEGVEMPVSSHFTVADSGEFIFTKTANDPPPTDPNDLWVWKQAMFLKEQFFGPDNHVYQARKGVLTVYFWKDFQIKNASLAHIFDSSRPDTYARIFAKDMEFEDFKKIVGTMKLRQN